MSESTKLINQENVQTVIAVCFVIALLALAMNFYNLVQIHRSDDNTLALSAALEQRVSAVESGSSDADALQARIAALEGQITALEEWKAAEDAEDAAEGEGEAPE